MDEIAPEYDVVVLGTGPWLPRHNNRLQLTLGKTRTDRMRALGVQTDRNDQRYSLTVCSVLSVKGKKVLHIDRNDHYGG